jgi:deoxyribodipyrimidine photolyase-related protein
MPKTKKLSVRSETGKTKKLVNTGVTGASLLILFPNQLVSVDVLKDVVGSSLERTKIILIEHPLYYTRPDGVKFSQLKLVYHRATVRHYMDYLSHAHIQIRVVDVDECLAMHDVFSEVIQKYKGVVESVKYIDPVDNLVSEDIANFKPGSGQTITRLASPLFMLTDADLEEYDTKKGIGSKLTHAAFYTWHRDRLGLLAGSRTYDTENRSRMPPGVKIPELPKLGADGKEYIKAAAKYISGHAKWSKHPGGASGDLMTNLQFPLTYEESHRWLDRFLAERFAQFGKYQDSIVVSPDGEPQNYLFHSCISPMLNIGLLTPREVVDAVVAYRKKHTDQIPMAAYEGFIRQVIGWREYQRYIYVTIGPKIRKMNHFGNVRRLTQAWYDGTTGIQPVDDAIKMAWRDGYLHHILRLMVMGNFMNLVGLHPDDVYRWFMEFALDAYDWVMIGNVYSMAMWADGGMTMRKPYLSSSKYILDMSNYSTKDPKTGKRAEWLDKWDAVFHHFIDRNGDALLRTYHAGIVRALRRKARSTEVQDELKLATRVINEITS